MVAVAATESVLETVNTVYLSESRRVLATLNQPHLKKLYRSVETDASNDGRVLVRF